jgi:hypothetical protein
MGYTTDPKHAANEDVTEAHRGGKGPVISYLPDEKREANEVFKPTDSENGAVDFRTVSWQRATVIFLKIQFAMSILSVPASCATLGAVGGGLSIVGWGVLNTCTYYPLAPNMLEGLIKLAVYRYGDNRG